MRMKHEFQIAAAVAVVTQAEAMRGFLDRTGPGGFFLCGNATDPSTLIDTSINSSYTNVFRDL